MKYTPDSPLTSQIPSPAGSESPPSTGEGRPKGKERHVREILRGSGIAFFWKVLGALLAFALSLILTRTLGAEGSGVYFLAFTIITIVSSFSRAGIDNALLRFASICWEKRDFTSLSHLARISYAVVLAFGIVVAIALNLGSPWLAEHLFGKPALAVPLAIMSFGVVALSMAMAAVQLLKGTRRVKDSQLLEAVLTPGFTILALWYLVTAWGVNGAAWAFLLGAWGTAVLGVAMTQSLWTPGAAREPEIGFRKLMQTSIPLLGATSVNVLTNFAAPLFLGRFAELSDVAIYATASRAAFLTTIVLASVSTIAAPKFSALYSQGKMGQLEKWVRKVNLVLTVIALPTLLGYVLFAEEIMSLFGPEFTNGAAVLIILAAGQFVSLSAGSIGQLLMMTGHESASFRIMLGVAILNFVLNLALVPAFGVIGAAIATSATIIAKNVVAVVVAQRLIGISVLQVLPGSRRSI